MNGSERLERASTALCKFRGYDPDEARASAQRVIAAWLGDDTMVLVHCEHFESDAVCDVMCEAYVNGEGWMPLIVGGET